MDLDLDLEFWLTAATLLSGIIWLGYRLLAGKRAGKPEPVIVEYARSFFPVLLVVLLLRSFVAEPFRIPSGSMLPTLEIGDFILVNKFAYGVRLPVLHTKVLPVGEPQRGDVMVFRYPQNPKVDYIKRLVGVPGDVVEWDNKALKVNGKEADRTVVSEYEVKQEGMSRPTLRLAEKVGEVGHDILIVPNSMGPKGSITVPEGHYFVMGDNRDMSNDGRMWGLVPEENVVGKATYVWMHFNWQDGGLDFSRIGTAIR